jgi:hypothetical protein
VSNLLNPMPRKNWAKDREYEEEKEEKTISKAFLFN